MAGALEAGRAGPAQLFGERAEDGKQGGGIAAVEQRRELGQKSANQECLAGACRSMDERRSGIGKAAAQGRRFFGSRKIKIVHEAEC
ncbi:MAG: hypothetical protein LAN70_09945 [Acidobacteriia bacterium]|nr:hypothetical protein [Terriglobia bacterium]